VATILQKRRVPKHQPPRDLAPLVVLDHRVLYWPDCGHGLDDDAVLYDRPVCVHCEEAVGDR
jgi:hypothetical protein